MARTTKPPPMSLSMAEAADAQPHDAVVQVAGPWGWWQARQAVLLALLKMPIAWFQLSILFLAPPQPFWCEGEAPLEGEAAADACLSLVDDNPQPCQRWVYNRTVFDETIVSEWDLVCSRHQLPNVTQLVLMLGVLVGNIVFGAAADRWGRRSPLQVAIVLQAVAGLATAFVPWLSLFMALRFLVAMATGGIMVVSFVICMEMVGGAYRTVVPILYQIPFSLGVCFLAGTSYFFRNWRDFQLTLGAFSVPFIAYYWLIPESPRWLLAVGRDQEALAVLEDAARANGRDAEQAKAALQLGRAARAANCRGPSPGLPGLFKTPRLRRMTICLSLTWFVVGLDFFGFSQFQGQIGGDIFVNVALSGLISLPGPILCAYLVRITGRKNVILGSLLTSSIASMLIMAVPLGMFAGDWPRALLAGLAVLGMSVSFPALYLYAGELLPTVVRNVGMGASSMCARIGSMAAPFILTLRVYGDFVPLVILGALPLIGVLLILPLPETRDCVLPDSLQDGENFCRERAKEDMRNANYIQVPLKEVTLEGQG